MGIFDPPAETDLRRAKLRRWLVVPRIWLPAIVGGLGIAFAAISGTATGWSAMIGISALAISAVMAVDRWFRAGGQLEREAHQDLIARAEADELSRLARLRETMRTDRDPHSTQVTRKLVETARRLFSLASEEMQRGRATARRDALRSSAELYESCQRLLARSLELWSGSRDMATDDAREEMLRQRAEILRRVEESMGHLGASLDYIRSATMRDDEPLADHGRLQQELDMGLETARQVETRMNELERELKYQDRMSRE